MGDLFLSILNFKFFVVRRYQISSFTDSQLALVRDSFFLPRIFTVAAMSGLVSVDMYNGAPTGYLYFVFSLINSPFVYELELFVLMGVYMGLEFVKLNLSTISLILNSWSSFRLPFSYSLMFIQRYCDSFPKFLI